MKLLRYTKAAFMLGPKLIYYYFRYFIKFSKHPERYPLELRYEKARTIIQLTLRSLKADVRVENMELFTSQKEKTLIICNHLSFMDPLVIIANSEKPVNFIAKEGVMKMPFVGKIAKSIGVFTLDKDNMFNQLTQIKNVVSYLKDPNNPNVIVYIEGTRNPDAANPCVEFHPGTLKIAQMAGTPLITAATFGTFRILDKKSYLKMFPTQLKFIKTYDADFVKAQQTTEFAKQLQDEIDREVDNQRRFDLQYLKDLQISDKKFAIESRYDDRIKS